MRRTLAIAGKELRHVVRDPVALAIVVVLPGFLLFLFGYALTLDVDEIRLAVCDLDRTEESRALVLRFLASDTFVRAADVASAREIEALLDRGDVKAGLAIPPGFARDLGDGRRAAVQVLIDGSDSNTARIVQGYAQLIARTYGSERLVARLATPASPPTPPYDVRARVWFNPDLKSAKFIVPGLLGILLLVATVVMTAMTVARERERGTLDGLLASPARPIEIVLGKTLPYVGIAFVDLFLALAVARLGFGVGVAGSFAFLLAVVLAFVVGSLGYGLFISTVAGTQQTAWTLALLTTILPSFLLSGFIFPIESMPAAVQAVTYAVPVRWFLEALRGIVLKGVGLEPLLRPALALVAFAVLFPAVAAHRFRRVVG